MAITATATDKDEGVSFQGDVRNFAREQTERWCLACEKFLNWEREHIIRGNPSAQEQKEHKHSLKWLLRVTRLIHASAADPDFPDHSMAKMLDIVIWKLDESWKMIYEPMPDEEADKLLAEIFPDAP